jgi:hypothetical protein
MASCTHRWALFAQGPDLGPAGGHVGEGEGLAELPSGISAVVAHQVDLQEPRLSLVPLGEGADGDLPAQQRSRLGAAATLHLQAPSLRGQQPVDRGRRDPEQLDPDGRVQVELAGPLHGLHRLGHERGQTLAGGGVQHGPDPPQRCEDVVAVDRWTRGRPATRDRAARRPPEGLASVVPVPPGEGTQFVQDLPLGPLGPVPVPGDHLPGHRLAFSHGERHPRAPSPPRAEGRRVPRGHFHLRQRSDLAGISAESSRPVDRIVTGRVPWGRRPGECPPVPGGRP